MGKIAETNKAVFPEMEFLYIKGLESFAPCYSQSLLEADFKKSILFSGLKNSYKTIPRNKKTRVHS